MAHWILSHHREILNYAKEHSLYFHHSKTNARLYCALYNLDIKVESPESSDCNGTYLLQGHTASASSAVLLESEM